MICEKADRTDIPTIDKKKYLVPSVRSSSASISDLPLIAYFLGSYCRPIRLCHPETNQVGAREGDIHLRRRGAATDSRTDECYL